MMIQTNNTHPQHNQHPRCPRCGYNLRGITQTWNQTGACPLQGKCSECGLDFDWHHIFHIATHPWLFEHHWRHHSVRSLIRTTLATLRPSKFWRDVHLYDRVRILPLITVIILNIILVFTMEMILTFILNWQNWKTVSGGPYLLRITNLISFAHGTLFVYEYLVVLMLYLLHGVLAWGITMPVILLALPVTLRQAKVQMTHVVRISCYSLFIPIVIIVSWSIFKFIDSMIMYPIHSIFAWIDPWQWSWDWLFYGYFRTFGANMLIAFIFAAWWGIWWAYADRNYLRLQNWMKVWTCQMIVSFFVTANVLFWMDQFGSNWLAPWLYNF